MNYKEESSADEDIPAILSERIFKLWQEGKTLIEIAQQLNLKIAKVKRILKARQKSRLQQGR